MKTTVVNIRKDQKFDIYIGRGKGNCHWGNPFPMRSENERDLVIKKFDDWLDGNPLLAHIQPKRRQWILDNMGDLKGKRLGCFCKPKPCHGDSYVRRLGD